MIYFKKVFVAEKPSVAKAIASVIGANVTSDGYFHNDQIAITWCYGHLVELADPVSYNPSFEKWNISDLPITPDIFNLQVKNDSGVKKQFKILSSLFNNSEVLVNAADAGREGELIFRLVYQLSKSKKPFQRLWISSMTEEAITKGINNLKNGNEYDRLYDAAMLRSVSDWLIGINSTRAFSLNCNIGKVLSLGRVQSPCLFMICQRFYDNQKFKTLKYFIPGVNVSYNSIPFTAYYIPSEDDKFPSTDFANKLAAEIKDQTLSLTNSDISNKSKKASNLFDLTSLQRICNTKYKYTASQTLEALQNLYETHKLVTYPRTDSNYLNSDLLDDVKIALRNLHNANINEAVQVALGNIEASKLNISNKFVFDDTKVSDHHAVIPTTNKNIATTYKQLNEIETNVYNEIISSFIKVFLPDYSYKSIQYLLSINDHNFSAKGVEPLELGWNIDFFDKKDKVENVAIPLLPENFNTQEYKIFIDERSTKGPVLLTEATLLGYMMNVHTFFKEEDFSNLKASDGKGGIGTPATRNSIIDTLKTRNYIDVTKNKLIPTELGLFVFDKIKNLSIANPKLTSDIENYLNKIESNEIQYADGFKAMTDYTRITTKQILDLKIDSSGISFILNKDKETGINCPKCKAPVYQGKKNFYCSTYPDCDFSLFKDFFGKKLTTKNVSDILTNKKPVLKLKSKAKKPFSAKVILDHNFTLKLEFETKIRKEKK